MRLLCSSSPFYHEKLFEFYDWARWVGILPRGGRQEKPISSLMVLFAYVAHLESKDSHVGTVFSAFAPQQKGIWVQPRLGQNLSVWSVFMGSLWVIRFPPTIQRHAKKVRLIRDWRLIKGVLSPIVSWDRRFQLMDECLRNNLCSWFTMWLQYK